MLHPYDPLASWPARSRNRRGPRRTRIRSRAVSANLQFVPLSEHGRGLLDELERRTGVTPYVTDGQGARTYWLSSVDVGAAGFDSMLNRIDPDWRQHLAHR